MTGRKESRGDRLAALRVALTLSPAEVARRSEFSRSIVSLWENGKRELSGSDRVYEGLARAFKVAPSTLKQYLDGHVALSMVIAEGPLDQALKLNDNRWGEVAIRTAQELERQMTRAQARRRSPAAWVKQLESIEHDFRRSIKTRLERLLSDEDPFDDTPATSAPAAKRVRRP